MKDYAKAAEEREAKLRDLRNRRHQLEESFRLLSRIIAEQFKASGQHSNFEWFFLLVDAGTEQGIWARNGLDPEFVPTAASASQLKQQIGSGTKMGFVNTAEVLLARSQGTPVKVVAGYFGETSAKIYVTPDGPLRTGNDLNGKRVGILATTHTSYRAVSYLNAKLGINSEPVVLGNLANNMTALKSGKIDAFYSAEGAALPLVESGEIRLLLRLADVYPKPYTAVVVWATDDLIQQNPDLVRAFVKATLQTVQNIKENPEHAADLVAKRTNAPKGTADKIVAELNKVLRASGRGSGQDLVAAVAGNWRFTEESGAVPAGTTVNVEDAVDVRFLP